MAFPCGLSVNNVAAHWAPNIGEKRVLQQDDVVKVDFGTQVEGRIIDSAWTFSFNEKFKPLIDAAKDATYAGVKVPLFATTTFRNLQLFPPLCFLNTICTK